MLLSFRTLCLAVALSACGPFAAADQPSPKQPNGIAGNSDVNRAGATEQEEGPILVVAHKRLLNRIATWTDAPAACLFDRGNLATDVTQPTVPSLPIARLLKAKCYLYCPSEELPIEAIYRERLANHGVKVIPIASPSQRRSNEQQKSALLATLQ
ncbi:MAG: hypothetical protein ACF787_11980 [Rhodopirellula sp. JB053]